MNNNAVNVVIVGNIAHDVNTFPNRDNGKDLGVVLTKLLSTNLY